MHTDSQLAKLIVSPSLLEQYLNQEDAIKGLLASDPAFLARFFQNLGEPKNPKQTKNGRQALRKLMSVAQTKAEFNQDDRLKPGLTILENYLNEIN